VGFLVLAKKKRGGPSRKKVTHLLVGEGKGKRRKSFLLVKEETETRVYLRGFPTVHNGKTGKRGVKKSFSVGGGRRTIRAAGSKGEEKRKVY